MYTISIYMAFFMQSAQCKQVYSNKISTYISTYISKYISKYIGERKGEKENAALGKRKSVILVYI